MIVDRDPGMPGNSVVVESKAVLADDQDVVIHVTLSNDVPLRGFVIPLVAREVTPGAFMTSALMSRSDRLIDLTALIGSRDQFAQPDGTCGIGGFKTVTWKNSTTARPVDGSPEFTKGVRDHDHAQYAA